MNIAAVGWVSWVALVLSVLNTLILAVGAFVAWQMWSLSRRKLTGDQAAVIEVQVTQDRSGHLWHIRLTNTGQTQARKLEVLLDGVAIAEHPVVHGSSIEHIGRRLETMEPNSLFTFTLLPTMDGPSLPQEVKVSWTDIAGIRSETTTSITS